MLVTLVVQLRPDRLAEGELVGQAELVTTGERATVRDVQDLVQFARASAARACEQDEKRERGRR